MSRVYIETMIPSFVAARPSRDVVIAGKQEVARRRCELLTGLRVLAVDEELTHIADALLTSGAIRPRRRRTLRTLPLPADTGWISF